MKLEKKQVYKLLRARYMGLYKYHQFELYNLYVIDDPFRPNMRDILTTASSLLGPGAWGIDGKSLISKPEHFELARRYKSSISNFSYEDTAILSNLSGWVQWFSRYEELDTDAVKSTPLNKTGSSFAKIELNTFGEGYPEFKSYFYDLNIRDAFQETLGKDPSIRDFLVQIHSQPTDGLDILSAFDGTFSIGLGTAFESTMIKWLQEHDGMGWWDWYLSSHKMKYSRHLNSRGVGGSYEFTTRQREFVSFPNFCLALLEFDGEGNLVPSKEDTFPYPTGLGLVGYFLIRDGGSVSIPSCPHDLEDLAYYMSTPVPYKLSVQGVEVERVGFPDEDSSSIQLYGIPSDLSVFDIVGVE